MGKSRLAVRFGTLELDAWQGGVCRPGSLGPGACSQAFISPFTCG